MTMWPSELDVAPLREWPGTLTPKRKPSQFGAPLATTLEQLQRELRLVGAKDVELLIAVDASQFRLDGRPRANATAVHPGVVLSFTAKPVGRLSYPCDTYLTWQDNLRAITLALEALRRVNRYGVTKSGEQYRGFLALEQHPHSADAQERWLREYVAAPPQWTLDTVLRNAKRKAHPDTGGDADAFQRVLDAERALRESSAA